jgi:translation initiation factor IF-3
MQTNQYKVRVNNFIKVPQVRVILPDGSSAGVMDTRDAMRLAYEQNMDLVEINPKASPPVCKIVNYGKFKYEEKKKQSEAKKNHKVQELKEITFRPTTDENDLNHKVATAKKFLEEGDKVKFTIRFRGREIVHPEEGRDRLLWILEQLKDLIATPPPISMEGKFMGVLVTPVKKHS